MFIAIIGPKYAGKSSLSKLLMHRFEFDRIESSDEINSLLMQDDNWRRNICVEFNSANLELASGAKFYIC